MFINERSGVLWAPPSLPPAYGDSHLGGQVEETLRYVLIEEIAGNTVELQSWTWPLVDQQGHLFWPEDAEQQVETATVTTELLIHQMYEPSGLQRHPRSGDTFACTHPGDGWGPDDENDATAAGHAVTDLRTLFAGTTFDISADAREAAKVAYLGASAAIGPRDQVDPELIEEPPEAQAPAPVIALVEPLLSHNDPGDTRSDRGFLQ
jgi:hypothetical protein